MVILQTETKFNLIFEIIELFVGFPGESAGKESACNVGNLGSIPRSHPWVRKTPLEKGMATHSSILAWRIPCRGAWWAIVHGVAKSRT